MVEKCLLDTDILTAYLRQNHNVVSHVNSYLKTYDQLSISTITYYEIVRGLRYVKAITQLSRFMQFVGEHELIPLDLEALDKSAEIYIHLRQKGQMINEGDIFIAGTALAHGYKLVTNNRRHFDRISGLQSENWMVE